MLCFAEERGTTETKQKRVCFHFQPVERETRHFNPLVIPTKLQKELPFKSKPKQMKKRTKPSLETKRAVVMEPHEKSVSKSPTRLRVIKLAGSARCD